MVYVFVQSSEILDRMETSFRLWYRGGTTSRSLFPCSPAEPLLWLLYEARRPLLFVTGVVRRAPEEEWGSGVEKGKELDGVALGDNTLHLSTCHNVCPHLMKESGGGAVPTSWGFC